MRVHRQRTAAKARPAILGHRTPDPNVVDNSVLVVDETTTAEALYVGMTRGRGTNTALVCCDSLDLERHEQPATAHQVVSAALGRATAEESATEALRHVLDASESLAVLAPRLASVTAQLRRETPANPAPELAQLAARRSYIEQHARLGRLTRAGRDDRRTLRDLDDRKAELEEALAYRGKWLDEHADLFTYRDQLAAQVADRRAALGVRATLDQPDHLVELLGQVPDDHDGRARWAAQATRVEAYREQWGIEPDQLRRPPVDGIQYREWDTAVHSIELADRFDALVAERARERSLDRRLSIDRGLSIEL